MNIIIIAWGEGAKFPLYNNASSNIRVIGKEASILIRMIRSFFYRDEPNKLKIHCIGHSLGKQKTKNNIISTGLYF